jgi:hypothetical protein
VPFLKSSYSNKLEFSLCSTFEKVCVEKIRNNIIERIFFFIYLKIWIIPVF